MTKMKVITPSNSNAAPHPSGQRHTQTDGRVQMCPRNRAQTVSRRNDGQTKSQRDAQHPGLRAHQHGRSTPNSTRIIVPNATAISFLGIPCRRRLSGHCVTVSAPRLHSIGGHLTTTARPFVKITKKTGRISVLARHAVNSGQVGRDRRHPMDRQMACRP